ncbi:hypothetical protein [Planococcus lenghuensis]|uniref:Relaxasome subunit MobC n=1 Tax=Planococcus lenghuensis TaxID=2213202 RepID=A0A1Q2L559_9BACL|nr:hypothetical protein [Planococcus lenghuensis]AQQ55580.1 hypothetical protein B0X71_20625 [Planococcus lenghuensis]
MNNEPNNLAKSNELKQQITELQRKKKQLENETKRRASWEKRRARTKRLIETGALAEKYFALEDLSVEERENIFRTFAEFVKSKRQPKG